MHVNTHACAAGLYTDSIPEARKTYVSHNWKQYAFWAAAWLYTISNDPGYKQASPPCSLPPLPCSFGMHA